MRTGWAGSVAAVAAIALFAYFGFRVAALERRVDALAQRLGTRPSSDGAAGAGSGSGYEQRLAALEREQGALRDDLRTLEAATAMGDPAQPRAAAAAPQVGGEQHILSVIGKEQSRILDRQLQFHRDRWLQMREAALEQFAQNEKLSARQRDMLQQLLANELDGIVAILKQPDAVENPERVADDWLAVLEATDYAARKLLDPSQIAAWNIARLVERRILWPWLPEQ